MFFLAFPFNISQDALFLMMVANEVGLNPRKLIHSCGNAHAYLGVSPRADFWMDEENVKEFQNRFSNITDSKGYLELKNWYLENAPAEILGKERCDHIPFILEQLSKKPLGLPFVKLRKDIPLLDAINLPIKDVVSVNKYKPHKWDAKARMAV